MNLNAENEYPIFVHEAGHVLVAQLLGATSSFVEYKSDSDNPFVTHSDGVNPNAKVVIDFSGLLAEATTLAVGTLFREEIILTALEEIMLSEKGSPNLDKLSKDELRLFQHAKQDIIWAGRNARDALLTDEPKKILNYWKDAWPQSRELIKTNKDLLLPVAHRIRSWHESQESLKVWLSGRDAYQEAIRERGLR